MNNHPHLPDSQGLVRCPYLGLHDDSRTSLAYPSPWNHCYRVDPSSAVSVSHQANVCLKGEYVHCEVYGANTSIVMPRNLRGSTNPVVKKGKPKIGFWNGLILLSITMIFIVLIGQAWKTGDGSPADVSGSPINTPTEDHSDLFPDIPPFNTALLDPSPGPTRMAPRTCGHELDVAFGAENRFVLHRIAVGENLNLYANRYQTAVNAILYINHDMQMPIWENMVIVIPVGTTLVIGTPPFEVLEQEKILMSTDRLAERLNTDSQQFRRYNEFDDSCVEFSGWILIPRKRNGTR